MHLQISACLTGDNTARYPIDQLPVITRAIGRSREAVAAADRRLTARYLDKLKAEGRSQFTGTVSHITSSGFTVKLDENGLEGLVDLRPEEEKFSFDKWTMSLTSTTRRFQLLQSVEVTFIGAPAEGDFSPCSHWLKDAGQRPKEPKLKMTLRHRARRPRQRPTHRLKPSPTHRLTLRPTAPRQTRDESATACCEADTLSCPPSSIWHPQCP